MVLSLRGDSLVRVKHTPGPWSWQPSNSFEPGDAGKLVGAGGKVVLDAFGEGVTQAVEVNTEADARLIAAAPELLEAVRRLYRGLPSKEQREEMEALIARIEAP